MILLTKPLQEESCTVRDPEISPTLLRDSLGYRLLLREQTSGELLVLGATAMDILV